LFLCPEITKDPPQHQSPGGKADLRIEKILDIFPTHSQNILRLLPPPILGLLPQKENV
jgi:hypothetical protein